VSLFKEAPFKIILGWEKGLGRAPYFWGRIINSGENFQFRQRAGDMGETPSGKGPPKNLKGPSGNPP